MRGLATALNLTNRAVVNLGVLGSARNFEAYDRIKLGGANDTVNLTQTSKVYIEDFGGNNRITVGIGGVDAVTGIGNDVFVTGAAWDEIDGGGGNNTAHMGDGNDEYAHRDNRDYTGSENIWGEAGNDTIATAAGIDMADGGDGDDTIYTGGGDDRAYGGLGNDLINAEDGLDSLYGGDGNDTMNSDTDYYQADGSQTESDLLDGGAGNDRMSAGNGADRLLGGTGDDTLIIQIYDVNGVNADIDTLIGGAGIDVLNLNGPNFFGTESVEVILRPLTLVKVDGVTIAQATQMEALNIVAYGGGDHHIEGGALFDGIVTGQGDDLIRGLDGNDVIQSTFGADTIYGGLGDDFINLVQVGGADLIYGGLGNDRISLSVAYLSQTLEAGISLVDGGSGFDTLILNSSDRDVALVGTELFVGGVKVADITGFEALTQYGTNLAGLLNGFAGNDTLNGAGGNDTINGNNGDDSLDGGVNDDQIFGGVGNDTLLSGGGADSLYGGVGDDSLTFNADGFVDLLDGGTGLDRLTIGFNLGVPVVMTGSLASGGTISTGGVLRANVTGIESVTGFGSIGDDILLGGSGNDSLYAYGGADNVTFGAGDDTLFISLDAAADMISLGAGIDLLQMQQGLVGDLTFVQSANMQVRIGGVVVSTIQGAEALTVFGGAGNDQMTGGGFNDLFGVGNGANFSDTWLGDDTISVNVDLLVDTLFGGLGVDHLQVNGGADAITMDLSVPGKVLVKVAGGTVIDATGFESVAVYGGYSPALDDLLLGLGGNDTLFGNSGDDTIFGGVGDDSIQGGEGLDVMAGGGGADRFVYTSATQAAAGGPVFDRINDFTSGLDLIDLLNVDANSAVFGNDTFAFIGSAAFGNVAGQLRYMQNVGLNRTLIEADLSGDGVADMVIHLVGLKVLQATDFIL